MLDLDAFFEWAKGQSLGALVASVVIGPLLAYSIGVVSYHLLLSPLRSIPGPWYAAVSNFWITSHTLRLRKCRAIDDTFKKYGPIVRTGPNTVMFLDVPSMKTVYGSTSKYEKDPWYKTLMMNDTNHAMTTLPSAEHQARKRGFAPHYAAANLARYQPEIHDFTLELIKHLDDVAGKESFDCLPLFRHVMVDVILDSIFGVTVHAVKAWTAGTEDPMDTAINDYPKWSTIRGAVHPWFWTLLTRIPIPRWQKFCSADAIITGYVKRQVTEMRKQIQAGKIGESEKTPLLYRLLHHTINGEPLPDSEILAECMGHSIAGVDTSAISMSYFCWELARRPDILLKLQVELDSAMPDPRSIPDIRVLQELPYFNAFIKESFRMYTVAPSPLPRVVPATGLNILGYNIPPGTTVATQAWSMHRRESVFEDVDMFKPERWLNPTEEMNMHMIPFGYGERICGGLNLANMVIRIVMATMLRNFEPRAAPETTEKTMYMLDSFIVFPAGMQCKLFFIPRRQ